MVSLIAQPGLEFSAVPPLHLRSLGLRWREAPQLASHHILESSHPFSYHLIERISVWPPVELVLLPPVELTVISSKF